MARIINSGDEYEDGENVILMEVECGPKPPEEFQTHTVRWEDYGDGATTYMDS